MKIVKIKTLTKNENKIKQVQRRACNGPLSVFSDVTRVCAARGFAALTIILNLPCPQKCVGKIFLMTEGMEFFDGRGVRIF